MTEILPTLLSRSSPNFSSPRGMRVDLIVLHDCEGGYEGSIRWFEMSRSNASAWRAHRRAVDGGKQSLERRPVKPLLDPGPEILQPSHTRSPLRRRTKVGTGHGATSANHRLKLKSRETNPPHSCKDLFYNPSELPKPERGGRRIIPRSRSVGTLQSPDACQET
jgi:hypothetical protein